MRMRSYLMRTGSYLMIVGSSPMKLRSYEGVLIKAKGLTDQGVSQKPYIFFMKAVQRCLSV